MVKLRVAARIIPEGAYLASLDSPSTTPIKGEKKFPVIVRDPDEWYIGTLALEIKSRYQSLYKHDLGQIKYLRDNEDDCDLDPEQLVSELLVDEGRAAKDGSDQHVTIKVVQEQVQTPRQTSLAPDLSPAHFQTRLLQQTPRFPSTQSSLGKHAYSLEDYAGAHGGYRSNKRARLAEGGEAQNGTGIISSIEGDLLGGSQNRMNDTQSSMIQVPSLGNRLYSPELPEIRARNLRTLQSSMGQDLEMPPLSSQTLATGQAKLRSGGNDASKNEFKKPSGRQPSAAGDNSARNNSSRSPVPQNLSPSRQCQQCVKDFDIIPESDVDGSQAFPHPRQEKILFSNSADKVAQNNPSNSWVNSGPDTKRRNLDDSEDESNDVYEDALTTSPEISRDVLSREPSERRRKSTTKISQPEATMKPKAPRKTPSKQKKSQNLDSDKENRPQNLTTSLIQSATSERNDHRNENLASNKQSRGKDVFIYEQPGQIQPNNSAGSNVPTSAEESGRKVGGVDGKGYNDSSMSDQVRNAVRRQKSKKFKTDQEETDQSEHFDETNAKSQTNSSATKARKENPNTGINPGSPENNETPQPEKKKRAYRKKALGASSPGEQLSRSLQDSAKKPQSNTKSVQLPTSQTMMESENDEAVEAPKAAENGKAPQKSSTKAPSKPKNAGSVSETASKPPKNPDKSTDSHTDLNEDQKSEPPKKKRGRPPKNAVAGDATPAKRKKKAENAGEKTKSASTPKAARSNDPAIIPNEQSHVPSMTIREATPEPKSGKSSADKTSTDMGKPERPLGLSEEDYELMKSREGMTQEQYDAEKKKRKQNEAKRLAVEKKKQEGGYKKNSGQENRATSLNIDGQSEREEDLPNLADSQTPVENNVASNVDGKENPKSPKTSLNTQRQFPLPESPLRQPSRDSSMDRDESAPPHLTIAESKEAETSDSQSSGEISESAESKRNNHGHKEVVESQRSSSSSPTTSPSGASSTSPSSSTSSSPAPPTAQKQRAPSKPINQSSKAPNLVPTPKVPVKTKAMIANSTTAKDTDSSLLRKPMLLKALHEKLKASSSSGTSTPLLKSSITSVPGKKSILDPASDDDDDDETSESD